MNNRVVTMTILVIASLLASPVVVADDTQDIPTNAQNTGAHDSLVAALSHAGLVSALQADGPFTVFAPTDDAFAAAGIDLSTFDTDEENATLSDILLYHVVSGAVASSDVSDGMSAEALNGDDVSFTVSGGSVMVNDATVTSADVMASNGIIHVIDKVLMPPADITEEDGDICYNMVTHTVVAGASFAECMSYAYYEDYEMNGQTFTGCYNTVTHTFTMVSQAECEAYMWTPAVDIAMTASATTIHNSLVAALTQAELVATLQGDGPFTVFAPTDDAFAAAGIDLAALDSEEGKATLTDILLYHVVSGAVPSSAVTDGMSAAAVNGDDLSFAVGEGVMVNDANVVLADVPASNGVIHVIDKVLMPPADITEEDGDICYNMVTHTVVAGASFAECMSYAYYEDYEMNGQTFTGCYNTVTHTFTMVSQAECEAYMWTPAVDIAMTASATTIHNSLVAALTQAELVATLQGDGPFTVFAPTDDAFAAAGIDLAALDSEEGKATLTDILLYHVVSGAVPSSAVTDGMSAAAVNGDDLSFAVGEGVMVNDANVVLADVPASNGVIHVIDKVLMPPADEPVLPEGCDYVVGIDDSGYAYDVIDLSIEVGQTVCWIWEDESMAHNVAQIENEGDTNRMLGGKYSGMAMTTVDYRVTFDENQTFLYICEPHATMDMIGKVVVGTGIMEEVDETDSSTDSNSVPGFTAGLSGIALAAAVIMYGGRKSEL